MKAFLTFTIICLAFSVSAQPKEILEIRKLYNKTQAKKNSYTRLTQADFENSSEGGEITVYKEYNDIRLIEAIYYGHLGNAKYEYYYSSSKVYFVFIEEFNYNAPPTEPSYDQEKTSKEESRYYLWNDNMIRWIRPNGEYAEPQSIEFKEESNKILKLAVETLESVK